MERLILTGASSGIGAALAAEYARPGAEMLLIARDAARLAEVAAAAEAKGALVETAQVDVTDEPALRAAIEAYDDAGSVTLVIANAGIAIGRPKGAPEREGAARQQIEVNLIGALNTVEPLIPRFLERKAGKIALIGSIAGIRPQADEPSYSAAKAGLHGYGEGMRPWLRAQGVQVTVVSPGFVTTPMSAKHHGPKPFEISATDAAAKIARAVSAGRGRLILPWPWAVLLFGERFLPARISDWFERRFAAKIG